MRFFIFLLLFVFSSQADPCRQAFIKPSLLDKSITDKLNAANKKNSSQTRSNRQKEPALEVTDIHSFAEAMTKGMILSEKQVSLLSLYIENYFQSSFLYRDEGRKEVEDLFSILEQYPELSKPLFQERILVLNPKAYEAPESLLALIKRLGRSAGRVRARLYKIEANWGFWAKALSFSKKDVLRSQNRSKNSSKDSAGKAIDKASPRDQFFSFLDNWINPESRLFLKDKTVDREKKAVFLYKALKSIRAYLKKEGRDAQSVSQMMIDLIHSFGFEGKFNKDLLKSKSPQDKLQALYNILEEREELARDLGYESFEQAMEALNVERPSGSTKNENLHRLLDEIKQEIKHRLSREEEKEEEIFRVRPLSILESPFRGCLGWDCSSHDYFKTALDPNYIYFTMTDRNHKSYGHITLVLGKAKLTSESLKTAFVDKIQNIALDMIIPMLEAVRQTLAEEGYRLALPIDAGDHNGLSNSDSIRSYVEQEIIPNLENQLKNFAPHSYSHQYQMIAFDRNSLSRAKSRLPMFEFTAPIGVNFQVKKGPAYPAYPAPSVLKEDYLISHLFQLKDSDHIEDRIKFLKNLSIIEIMDRGGREKLLRSASNIESLNPYREGYTFFDVYRAILASFITDLSEDFIVRKEALFLFSEKFPYNAAEHYQSFLLSFSDKEQDILNSEIYNWKNSKGGKKQFIKSVYELYVNRKNSRELKDLLSSPIGKLVDLSFAGAELLYVAAARRDLETIDFLIEQEVNINAVDDDGDNIILNTLSFAERDKNSLSEWLQFIDLLRARGADVALWNNNGRTVISRAMEIEDLNIKEALQLLRFFIDRGFDSRAKSPEGRNPLMQIASYGKFEPSDFIKVSEFLIQRGLNINDVSDLGESIMSNLLERSIQPYSADDILFIFKELEKKGAKLKLTDFHSEILLKALFFRMIFLESNSGLILNILDFLINRGLNINAQPAAIEAFRALKGFRGASNQELYDFLEALFRRGADPYMKDVHGNHLLQYIKGSSIKAGIQQLLNNLKAEGVIAQ